MVHADHDPICAILDATGLFASDMLADMAQPYLSAAEPHIWLVACEGPVVTGFAYC